MTSTGASLLIDTLETYGITHLFGNPGTTELPLMNVIGDSDLEYIMALHEDVAVGMAAGYAKTRQVHAHENSNITPVGVANLHITPGVAHGLGNVFNASLLGTGAPLVVTAGVHSSAHQPHEANLQGDPVEMTRQFTKWSAEVKTIETLPMMLRRAVRVALTPPTGPVFLALPFDVMTAQTDAEPKRLGSIPTAGEGDAAAITAATEQLMTADDPVMVVGDLLARAGPDAVSGAQRLAEAGGMRVYGEFKLSELAFPFDSGHWCGRLPRNQERAQECLDVDTVVFAGVVSNMPTNQPTVEFIAADTEIVHLSNHAWEMGKNYASDVSVLGNLGAVTNRLADQLQQYMTTEGRARRTKRIEQFQTERRTGTEQPESTADDSRATGEQLASALSDVAPDARIVVEAPTTTAPFRNQFDFEPGQYFANRGGGLGYGLPAAIGSALAEAEQPSPRAVVGVIGDGSYLYYPHALYSAARYDIDVTVVVANNRNYRILKDNTLRLFGGEEAEYDFVGMDFEPEVDFAANARSHGSAGTRIDTRDGIVPAVEDALDQPGPHVLDVRIQD